MLNIKLNIQPFLNRKIEKRRDFLPRLQGLQPSVAF